ncbi:GNAT family N-acetyltransferase [Bifidobacterium choloepi]|uniref:GNAT N-acetyltransferase n=1 Tax=Bifidobacterium choloepi TaxID=2614131 RepID=A0A6I5NNL0_9BIFI|nr:GNAT family N-acetyltransferase [Bifidobacterium choloepi]NEG70302.1 GNAT N-acetyltransferase [Bifidobacterium choloepi]
MAKKDPKPNPEAAQAVADDIREDVFTFDEDHNAVPQDRNPRTDAANENDRELPDRIDIPTIRGEMVMLRPATIDDLPKMEELNAYHNASGVTGKDRKAERASVRAWVQRSIAWSAGRSSAPDGIKDPEARGTIAWSVLRLPKEMNENFATPFDEDSAVFLGMIFLIDIDGWSRSARIQVILGEDYRGRGYSRDAMPRVMTYGFADQPEGLGLHRIWVAVPEKSTRPRSVYQSLGFVPSGTSRDALWDAVNGKYQDLIVMDTLEDEYDPIRSLDAFGMHIVPGNPGLDKAMTMHEHSMALKQRRREDPRDAKNSRNSDDSRDGNDSRDSDGTRATAATAGTSPSGSAARPFDPADFDGAVSAGDAVADVRRPLGDLEREELEAARIVQQSAELQHAGGEADTENDWPYNAGGHASSKRAWWRTLGARRSEGRSRSIGEKDRKKN